MASSNGTTLADRILDFFNTVQDKYEIRYRIKDDPYFGSAPASGYGITLDVAQKILDQRAKLPGKQFSKIEEIDDVVGVGPVTLHNILYSFSDFLRAWTASADGQRVGTLRDVGVGTLVAEEKLQVYDGALSVTSYRDTPERVGVQNTPGSAYDVFVRGNYAYVADGSRFTILDVGDSASPKLLGNIALNDARGVFALGDFAYVADGPGGLQIILVSDPANPSLVSTTDTTGNARGVCVVGDYAYVADGSDGLQIIDVSDPANPSFRPGYNTEGYAEDVYVAGDYAFVADGSRGLQIFDVADPASPPTLVSSFDTDGDCRCVYIHGDRAYVADGSEGFRIVDISNPVELGEVGGFDTAEGQADDVFVSGNHAYVANGTSGIQVFDVSDLASPKLVDNFAVSTGDDARGIFVAGNHAYVADRNLGLIVYHVLTTNRIGAHSHFSGNVGVGTTSPGAPLEVQMTDTKNWARGLKIYSPDIAAGRIMLLHIGKSDSDKNTAEIGYCHDGDGSDANMLSLGLHGYGRIVNIRRNGCVGIGTGSPGARLEVAGEVRVGEHIHFDNDWCKIYSNGRMHLYGEELLWLLNKSGVVVGKEWGGSGNLWVEGRLYGGGGDYAEYYESHNGKEIPAGISVVLEDGKIRPARENETPIGVISASPGIVGGVHLEWPKKYLCDEFGCPIMEEYQEEILVPKKEEEIEVLDEDGRPVMVGSGEYEIRQRPKLNPEYDESQEYIPREQRSEWNCVGLLGRVPLRKGQPVAESWVKIKDVSDEVELWLVK